MLGFVFSGFVNDNIDSAVRNKTFGRVKSIDIADFAANETGGGISDSGNREKIWTELVNILFVLPNICSDR